MTFSHFKIHIYKINLIAVPNAWLQLYQNPQLHNILVILKYLYLYLDSV
jgi:hypothetical protein